MVLKLLFKLYQSKKRLTISREELEKYQKKKITEILLYAYDHSTYYRKKFTEKNISRKDIGRIPIENYPSLTKKELMKYFNEVVCSDVDINEMRSFDANPDNNNKLYKDKYHIVHSSGTTEKPGYFIYDEKAWQQMLIATIRAALWDMSMKEIIKLLSKKPRIVYIAETDGRYGGAMAVSDGIAGVKAKQLFLDIKMPLDEWIDKISKFQPNIIIGYPSAIKILMESVARGEIKTNLFRIISCGEPLSKNLRDCFTKTFKCKVINFYGASESLALGVEVGNEDEMYLFDDMNYIEILEDGIYITCLYNKIQPLIRYKISDKVTLHGISKHVPLTTVTNILGRNEDLLWFKDKNGKKEFLHPLSVEGFCIDGMLDYQFRKINDQAFEMIIELSKNEKQESVKNEMKKLMKKILNEKKLDYVEFTIRLVEDILPDEKTGKKKLIII